MADAGEAAKPYRSTGDSRGALVLHGFTGSPQSMRLLAEAFAADGMTVELPLLPGHGTSPDDLRTRTFADWLGEAEAAYSRLSEVCEEIFVCGLSMGGTLTAKLGTLHPEISGLILVNPFIEGPAESFLDILRGFLESGGDIPSIGSDIADPESKEFSYEATPVAPLLSLSEAAIELQPQLGKIDCPTILFTSKQDHVVPPSTAHVVLEEFGGPVEQVELERSYHVATLDYDSQLIIDRSLEFMRRIHNEKADHTGEVSAG